MATSENVVYKLKLVTWALESVFVGSELVESCVSLPEDSSGAVRVIIFCRWEPDVALRYETEQSGSLPARGALW